MLEVADVLQQWNVHLKRLYQVCMRTGRTLRGQIKGLTFLLWLSPGQQKRNSTYETLRSAVTHLIEWRQELRLGTRTEHHLMDLKSKVCVDLVTRPPPSPSSLLEILTPRPLDHGPN